MINTFRTLFEARERKFQQERLFRGESVDLVAKITTDGVLDTLSGYSISGVYQPTDDLSGDIYPVDAEIVDGKAILHWTNENDFGKDAYNVWGLLTKDGKAAYPICWRLMFAHSPSYPLGTPDPIPRTIDFSQYELLNAPWLPLSGGTLSGRIYYDIEEPVQITNLSSWIGDATGLGRGIITIYNETQNTLDDKYSQEDATLSGRWDNMWNPPNPTGPLVFPENPSEGDVFEPYAAMDGEYLNGKDVTFSKGTVLIANPGWETKEVPCFYIHVVYTYIYHVGEGWVPRSENDWCICKINGEWQAASFARGFTAYDSLVWHEFSEGGTEPREPDPFVLSSEIADFATKQYVQEAIASIPTPEVGNFATYEYVDGKFETKVHADETKIELDSKIATKVSKEELSAELSNYATESFVNDSFNSARTYTDEQIDWLSNVYMKSEEITATYETKQHAADTYHTKADAVADSTYLNGRIDAVSAAISSISVEGDYLPLSGGTVTGRIYYGEPLSVFTNHQEFYVSEVSATFFFDLELSAERSFLDGTYPYSFEDQNRDGNVRMRIRLDGDPQIYDFGSDVVHIWADLDDQTEEWLGTFTFQTSYNEWQPTFSGRYPNNDWERICTFDPSSGGSYEGIYPSGDPPTMDLYVWDENEGQYTWVTQVSFQKCWDNRQPLNYLTQAGTRDPFVLSSELPEVPTDLSSFANSPGYATSAYVQEYVDEHSGASGDYLPLSGGNLSGRIYLKTTETRIVGSTCIFTFSATETPYLSFEDQTETVNIFVSLSVENAGQEFVDMLTSEEWTGEGTDYTVKAYVEANEELYATNKSTTVTGTVSFGQNHADGWITIDLDFPEYAEDESNLIISEIVFQDDSGNNPTVHINYTADWTDYSTTEEYLNIGSSWTIDTVSEEVEVNEPFVISSEIPEVSAFATKAELSTKADLTALTALALDVVDNYCTNQYVSQTYATKNELSSAIGTINSILDSINGQVI